jgi:hypothetical protein
MKINTLPNNIIQVVDNENKIIFQGTNDEYLKFAMDRMFDKIKNSPEFAMDRMFDKIKNSPELLNVFKRLKDK